MYNVLLYPPIRREGFNWTLADAVNKMLPKQKDVGGTVTRRCGSFERR
jgi:hypothetical protein